MNQDQPIPPPTQPPAEPQMSNVRCFRCGYPLQGIAIGSRCPECGTFVDVSMQPATALPTSGHAIAALVLGILSILGSCMYGLPGVILGGIGLSLAGNAKTAIAGGRSSPTSAGLMTAGRVCSIIGLCLGGLYLVAIVLFLALGMGLAAF